MKWPSACPRLLDARQFVPGPLDQAIRAENCGCDKSNGFYEGAPRRRPHGKARAAFCYGDFYEGAFDTAAITAQHVDARESRDCTYMWRKFRWATGPLWTRPRSVRAENVERAL